MYTHRVVEIHGRDSRVSIQILLAVPLESFAGVVHGAFHDGEIVVINLMYASQYALQLLLSVIIYNHSAKAYRHNTQAREADLLADVEIHR